MRINIVRNLCVAVCSFGLSSAFAAPVIPIAPGTSWRYNMTEEIGKGLNLPNMKADADGKIRLGVLYRLEGTEDVDGKGLLKFEMHRAGTITNTDLLAVDEHGITCWARVNLDGELVKFTPPLIPNLGESEFSEDVCCSCAITHVLVPAKTAVSKAAYIILFFIINFFIRIIFTNNLYNSLVSNPSIRNPVLVNSILRSRGLNPVEDYEKTFHDYLGIKTVIWLGKGIVGDDTHGHVDDISRFVAADTVVAVVEDDPGDPNYAPLQSNLRRLRAATDQDGKPLRVIELPMPRPVIFEGRLLPASYANFYIANGIVLVPVFNDPNDRIALNILSDLFPGREIVGIYSGDLIWGFGAMHCMTQQEPVVSP